jgi:hypothetical protein|tara:strand:- start:6 stop:611 length:606 start_codon:yes stop_codon:yes gene_type:complete
MKKLLTEHIPFTVDKLLVEQSIKENKPLRVSGIIQRAGVKNHNGRIYEHEILEREIKKYIDGPVKEKRALGELDHPDSSVINLNNVSHNIVEVTMKGNDVHGVIEILTTPSGNILKELFRCGVTVGISSRGMGSVEEDSDGVLMVQEDFDLLCFDMVSTPSTPGAYLSPMHEGVSTPTTKYTKVHNIIRDIICDNTGVCKC